MKTRVLIGCGGTLVVLAIALRVFIAWWPTYPHVGDSALSHSQDGSITLHVYACPGEEVREITVRGGMEDGPGGSHNPWWAHLTRDDPQTGHFTVNLSHPEGWTEQVPTQIPTDPGKYLIAEAHPKMSFFDKGKLIRPVSLRLSELQAVPVDTLVRDEWQAPPSLTTTQGLENDCSDRK